MELHLHVSCPLRTPAMFCEKKFPEKQMINLFFIDQAFSVNMAGYWPRSFFVSLWTSTLSRSINMQKNFLFNQISDLQFKKFLPLNLR